MNLPQQAGLTASAIEAAIPSSVDPPDTDDGASRTRAQRLALPAAWRPVDAVIVRATEFSLFAVGVVFATLVTLEVISRYVFSFSIFFVNASARLLLVWFFMLGAGLALRHGAHVGFELIVSRLSPERRRAVLLLGYGLSLVFFVQMIWSGAYSIGPALAQVESGLGISLVWIVAAIPVGFLLLAYHAIVLVVAELRGPRVDAANRP